MERAETPGLGGAARGPRPALLRMRAQAHFPTAQPPPFCPVQGAVGRLLGGATVATRRPHPHPRLGSLSKRASP